MVFLVLESKPRSSYMVDVRYKPFNFIFCNCINIHIIWNLSLIVVIVLLIVPFLFFWQWTLWLLGRHSTIWATPPGHFCFGCFWVWVSRFCPGWTQSSYFNWDCSYEPPYLAEFCLFWVFCCCCCFCSTGCWTLPHTCLEGALPLELLWQLFFFLVFSFFIIISIL
jgi:hypothetical protein